VLWVMPPSSPAATLVERFGLPPDAAEWLSTKPIRRAAGLTRTWSTRYHLKCRAKWRRNGRHCLDVARYAYHARPAPRQTNGRVATALGGSRRQDNHHFLRIHPEQLAGDLCRIPTPEQLVVYGFSNRATSPNLRRGSIEAEFPFPFAVDQPSEVIRAGWGSPREAAPVFRRISTTRFDNANSFAVCVSSIRPADPRWIAHQLTTRFLQAGTNEQKAALAQPRRQETEPKRFLLEDSAGAWCSRSGDSQPPPDRAGHRRRVDRHFCRLEPSHLLGTHQRSGRHHRLASSSSPLPAGTPCAPPGERINFTTNSRTRPQPFRIPRMRSSSAGSWGMFTQPPKPLMNRADSGQETAGAWGES